jgi:hypothetical protein
MRIDYFRRANVSPKPHKINKLAKSIQDLALRAGPRRLRHIGRRFGDEDHAFLMLRPPNRSHQ